MEPAPPEGGTQNHNTNLFNNNNHSNSCNTRVQHKIIFIDHVSNYYNILEDIIFYIIIFFPFFY